MKLKFGNVLIALILFDFLIEWLGQSFFSTVINLTPPNIMSYINFNNYYNSVISALGNWGYFEVFAKIPAYLDAFISTIGGFFMYLIQMLSYILSVFNLPFSFLPSIIAVPLQLIFIGIPLVILIINLQVFSTSFGGTE